MATITKFSRTTASELKPVVKKVLKKVAPKESVVVPMRDINPGEGFKLLPQSDYVRRYGYAHGAMEGQVFLCTAAGQGVNNTYPDPRMFPVNGFPGEPGKPEFVMVERVPAPAFDASKVLMSRSISTSGCDPELFVVDLHGDVIPAFNFLPKQSRGVMEYYDGFQAEFGISAQACHGYSMDYVQAALTRILQKARAFDKTASLSLSSVMPIKADLLRKTPDDLVALGCLPSLNAYDEPQPIVADPRMLPIRVAGGHLHFGFDHGADWTSLDKKDHLKLGARWMDVMVGIPSVGMFEGLDDPLRRTLYGRAGEFRAKKYGIEYRTLSNAWLGHPVVAHVIWDLARLGTAGASQTMLMTPEAHGLSSKEVQRIINETDVPGARAFFNKHIEFYKRQVGYGIPSWKAGYYGPQEGVPFGALTKLVNEGVLKHFPGYSNIEDNWLLGKHWIRHTNGDALMFYKYASNIK